MEILVKKILNCKFCDTIVEMRRLIFFKSIYWKVSLLLLLPWIFCSCGPSQPPKFVLGDSFYYWESSAEATLGDAIKNAAQFKKLEDKSSINLRHVLGKGVHYVWVRAEFELPPYLKNQPLGLVVPHLKFAEQLWCNGNFISQYGNFPPHEQSTMFKAHFFSFPVNILNQEGKNTILIRIYAQGRSGISSHAYLHPTRFAYSAFETINFNHTRIYIFLMGILVFTFILYICFYLNVRKFKEFRDFAFINFFTAIFMIPFFSTELPIYTRGAIPFLIFIKLTLCIPPYFIVFFATKFARDYTKAEIPTLLKNIGVVTLICQIIVTLLSPTYERLMKITPFMLILLMVHAITGTVTVARQLSNPKAKREAIQFAHGFLPLTISVFIDLGIRLYDNTQTYIYYTIFGWLASICIFIMMLAIRFSRIYKNNEKLTNHLQEEVDSRTRDLQDANEELSVLNERLEADKYRSDMDLEMASAVQKNFFSKPNKHFVGWDIGICYVPQAKVSGDLYDYYNYNDILNGISLFDVSGHGLSASLVTMLSKNIISRIFQKGFRDKDSIDKILTKINSVIIAEKGDIDNYMTGILCRFENIENGNKCKVELGNAGHPYPIKFSAKDGEIQEIKGTDGKRHYGAIGMKGIMVSFASSKFIMEKGDILFLYTDGISEATNFNMEQFGTQTIKSVIKEHCEKSAEEILKLIMDALSDFTKSKPVDDDITLIIAKRTDATEFNSDDSEEDFDELLEELEDA